MRLINTTTLLLESKQQCPTNLYAILSHTWGSDAEELDFAEFKAGQGRQKKGFEKIRLCCEQALEDGLQYAWVDTCCIDKRSSAELSEAINSMYSWYALANICYVYLADIHQHDPAVGKEDQTNFRHSRWFTRGWTLQELIAPRDVSFYTRDWTKIGDKADLAQELHTITGIDLQVLGSGKDLRNCSVAQRMSWASRRETTRLEDEAYCLLGLFNVNMPLLYGEGSKAFLRLQEAIISESDDETIFCWTGVDEGGSGLLAPHPRHFSGSLNVQQRNPSPLNIRQSESHRDRAPYAKTNRGLSIQCQMLPCGMNTYVVPLRCEEIQEGSEPRQICIFVCRTLVDCQYRRVTFRGISMDEVTHWDISKAKTSTIYVPSDGPEIQTAPHGELPLIHIKSKLHAWRFDDVTGYEIPTNSLSAMRVVDSMPTHGEVQYEDEEASDAITRWKPRRVAQVQFQSRNLEEGVFLAFTRSAASGTMFYYHLEFGFDMEFNPVCTLYTWPFWLEGNSRFQAWLRSYRSHLILVLAFYLLWLAIFFLVIKTRKVDPPDYRPDYRLLLLAIPAVLLLLWWLNRAPVTRRRLHVCENSWIKETCTHIKDQMANNGLPTREDCVECRFGRVRSWSPMVIHQLNRFSDHRLLRAAVRYGRRIRGNRFGGLKMLMKDVLPAAHGCVSTTLEFRPLGTSSWQLELHEEPSHSGLSQRGDICWRRWSILHLRSLVGFFWFMHGLYFLMLLSPVLALPVMGIGGLWFPNLLNISQNAGVGLCALIVYPPICWTIIGVAVSRYNFPSGDKIPEYIEENHVLDREYYFKGMVIDVFAIVRGMADCLFR